MKPTVYIRPLVPRHLFQFSKGLEKALPKGHNSFVVYHPKISLLVDPQYVKDKFSDQELTDLAFDGSVDLVLIDGLPDGVPYAAFDVWRGDEPENHKIKVKLFERLGIWYGCLESQVALSHISDIVKHISQVVPDVDKLRPAINPAQWAAMERVANVAKKNGLYLLHEVALESVIAIQAVQPNDSGRGLPLFLNRDFLGRTSFDAIVTTPPPNAKPICAVEFDGRHHSDRAQKDRDARKNAACAEAKLPLIRVPARDTTVSESTRKIVLFQDSRSPATPEISWKLLEAIVTALSRTHLKSVWYLQQLHHFLQLEAEHLKSIDPDSSLTIQSYAEDIWHLATGQIATLEERVSQLIELDEEKATFDEVVFDYRRQFFDDAGEDLYRADDVPAELHRQITENFDAFVLKQSGPFRLFELRDWSESTEGGTGKSYMMSIESSTLLNELGVRISKKTFTEGPFGLEVIGDHYGVATDLIMDIPKRVLLERVRRVAHSHRTRIRDAVENGEEIIWVNAAAEIWSQAELPHIRQHLIARVKTALQPKTLASTPEAWEKFRQGDDSGLEYQDVPNWKHLKRLNDLSRRIRLVLERLSIDAEEKERLSDYFELLVAKAKANPEYFLPVRVRNFRVDS